MASAPHVAVRGSSKAVVSAVIGDAASEHCQATASAIFVGLSGRPGSSRAEMAVFSSDSRSPVGSRSPGAS